MEVFHNNMALAFITMVDQGAMMVDFIAKEAEEGDQEVGQCL